MADEKYSLSRNKSLSGRPGAARSGQSMIGLVQDHLT